MFLQSVPFDLEFIFSRVRTQCNCSSGPPTDHPHEIQASSPSSDANVLLDEVDLPGNLKILAAKAMARPSYLNPHPKP